MKGFLVFTILEALLPQDQRVGDIKDFPLLPLSRV